MPSVPPITVRTPTPKTIVSHPTSGIAHNANDDDMSITALLKKVSEGNKEPQNQQSINSVYGAPQKVTDTSKIQELWIRYARSIANQDTHLYALMQQIPTLENGENIVVTATSNLQANKLRESTDLINFLRAETGVQSLKFDIRITATENSTTQQTIAYTPKQKLEQMIAENKTIEALINEFSLDVDY